MRRRVDDTTDKLQQMLGLRQEYEQAKKLRKQSEQRIKAARNIQLMGMLENLAKQVGIDTKEIEMNPRSPATNPETNIEEERVEVKLEKITIDSLVEFLQRIESRSDTIAVRSLHVKHNFREPKFLSVDFTVSKFQLREQPEKHGKARKG
ncbi:MAG: hypothetical protein D6806_08705 [Deltaproteobacteria bacterium]|nr:MAG: hypothetical protein D6806_08705 [Deltaproteobacteria bacterium]